MDLLGFYPKIIIYSPQNGMHFCWSLKQHRINNVGNQTVLVPIDFHCIFYFLSIQLKSNGTCLFAKILQYILFYVGGTTWRCIFSLWTYHLKFFMNISFKIEVTFAAPAW